MKPSTHEKTTLHDLISGLGYDYDSQGRRMSNFVEDRRHWKPEPGALHRLSIAGEELPPAAPDFIPKATYPAGDPRWQEGALPEADFEQVLQELSDHYQNTLNDIDYGKPSLSEFLKDTSQRTLWEMLNQLEEWGWGG